MKGALSSLLADRHFDRMCSGLVPWLPRAVRNALLRTLFIGVKTPLDFQLRFMKPVVKYVLHKCSKGVSADFGNLDKQGSYTFISNHRDIVLDSAILDLELHLAGFRTTCEIAIGDNLLIYPWIETLVKMNKAFVVRRSLAGKDRLEGSRLMSRYMHHAIGEKHENIWIAQREGRAKDSSDETQYSLLRMLNLGGGSADTRENLRSLHLVPLTISYEYDPCDYLKATEFQLKRDNPDWKKSKQDDLDNMRTGIFGYKGHIAYVASEGLDAVLDAMPEGEFTKEQFIELAARIDRIIHSGYTLYPGNYVAADMLSGTQEFAAHYTERDRKKFLKYLEGQYAKIRLEHPDREFLMERMLTMYANPVRNKMRACGF
jgi:hypothetical protein